MADAIQVRGWEEHFENARTLRIKGGLPRVMVPTNQSKDGYVALVSHRNGAAHLGVWLACLQVAANCRPRGELRRDSGEPHTAASLSLLTRIPEKVIAEGIERLCAPPILWMVPVGTTSGPGRDPVGTYKRNVTEPNVTEPNETEPKGASAPDVMAVIAHYRSFHPRARPGDKERKLIRARLKEGYSVADLQAAIDGCHRSPHHCGENPSGTCYQTLELIVRDSKHVQQFMEIAENGVHRPSSAARRMASWAERRSKGL